jgi:1-acyl-sn-glycerol-3-phosphate acyltransferase
VERGGGRGLRRRSSDRAALEAALQALRRGWVVGISPEGRRSPDGALVRGHAGAAFLARRGNVPIVPVAITNTAQIGASLRRLRRAQVTVRVGEPFRLPRASRPPSRATRRDDTDRIMCRIAELLPPRCHGVYAGHRYLAARPDAGARVAAGGPA